MSLYRQPGRVTTRALALAAAAALLAGIAGGFALGRATAAKPTLADKVADLRTALRPAEQGLELTATEYAQAVRGGRVTAPTEYDAARADVGRVRDALASTRADRRALDVSGAQALESAVDAVDAAVRGRVEPAEVQRRSDAARRALRDLLDGARPTGPDG
jgi:F0F1-type ATP synthase membrane subunit b/b'